MRGEKKEYGKRNGETKITPIKNTRPSTTTQKQKLRSKRRLSNRPTQEYKSSNINNQNTTTTTTTRTTTTTFKKPIVSDQSLFM